MSDKQLTGLRFMFQPKFFSSWLKMFMVFPFFGYGLYWQKEYDKAAYGMRGKSHLFKKDAEKLAQSGTRELWE